MRLRNVRNTRRAMIVPTVEATPSSSPRMSRIKRRMKSPEEYSPWTFHRPILDDAIYRCRAENLTLRMSCFSPCERDRFSPSIFEAISVPAEGLAPPFRSSLRGGVEQRRLARHEAPHPVNRGVFVRRVSPGSVAQAGRHPGQPEVLVEGKGGHRASARRPDLRFPPVRLDRFDRGLCDPRLRVRLRGAVRPVDFDA